MSRSDSSRGKVLRGKRCLGFGVFDHICENVAGPNPYWCVRCDKLRIEHLDIRFKEISRCFLTTAVDMDGTGA